MIVLFLIDIAVQHLLATHISYHILRHCFHLIVKQKASYMIYSLKSHKCSGLLKRPVLSIKKGRKGMSMLSGES